MKNCFKVLILLLSLSFSVFFTSCSTDFDINAEPKDIMVVYGLLNQGEKTQYIKITKAFLGDQDALVMAQDPQNSSYGDNLTVSLEEWKNGTKGTTYYFTKTTISDKETGVFYSPNQEVYVATTTNPLKSDCIYKLFITNSQTGKLVSAETSLVNESLFKLKIPMSGASIGFVNNDGDYASSEVKWLTAKSGRLYEPVFRFHYSDINKATLVEDTTKYVDWILGTIKSTNLDGNEELSIPYDGESFFKILQGKIPLDGYIKRYAIRVELIMSMGGDELSTYIDVNKPSNSIVQERPAYTNISNGIGIFSARYQKIYKLNITAATRYALKNNDYTKLLNFE